MAAIGLVLLVVSVLVGAIVALANSGSDHLVTNFTMLGVDSDLSSGRVLIYGAILGALAMLGLNMLLAGTQRGLRHRMENRRNLKSERKRNAQLEKELADRPDATASQQAQEPPVDVTDSATTEPQASGRRFRS